MKNHLIILIACVALLTSCENNNYHSPLITITDISVNDTIMLHGDTLFVGDTLKLAAYLNPYYHTITKFDVTVDRNYIKDSIFQKVDYEALCDTVQSKKSTGNYVMKNLTAGEAIWIRNMQFAVTAAPTTASSTQISLSLTSDVNLSSEYNPNVWARTVIIANKTTAQ